MLRKKECIAMLLAGGQGSRLKVLTENIAKPAIPYGGKYRIIDFPLSNCVNSGIDTVGVLTQYQPLVLNEYIGGGEPWDLDRVGGGVHVLPPYQKTGKSDWYKGTANAIYQNIPFIDRYDPEYVLVLSGDHIYKMDYNSMLTEHKARSADCTIAVMEVPMDEASRFGIMNAKEDGTIYEFEEKPKNPKSNLASMGIYIFSWKKMRKYLIDDENDEKSHKDFGHDIIPAMLNKGEKLIAYRFEGYWKDVGTIDSLWDANMDLINPNVPMNLHDKNWKIYSRNPASPPQYISEKAEIEDCMISDGSKVYGKVNFSVIYTNVTIEEGAVVTDSIVMPGAVIKKDAVVEYAIIGENAVVSEKSKIGGRPENYLDKEWGVCVVGPDAVLEKGTVLEPAGMIGKEEN
ncbi:MAG: glucose-1-phosphate adenylyltransferase [Oscillospiraceae bacterium]|nr:glucose-1-phosphate adenylyltransferase [Oscillospiraceae bacterium]